MPYPVESRGWLEAAVTEAEGDVAWRFPTEVELVLEGVRLLGIKCPVSAGPGGFLNTAEPGGLKWHLLAAAEAMEAEAEAGAVAELEELISDMGDLEADDEKLASLLLFLQGEAWKNGLENSFRSKVSIFNNFLKSKVVGFLEECSENSKNTTFFHQFSAKLLF